MAGYLSECHLFLVTSFTSKFITTTISCVTGMCVCVFVDMYINIWQNDSNNYFQVVGLWMSSFLLFVPLIFYNHSFIILIHPEHLLYFRHCCGCWKYSNNINKQFLAHIYLHIQQPCILFHMMRNIVEGKKEPRKGRETSGSWALILLFYLFIYLFIYFYL